MKKFILCALVSLFVLAPAAQAASGVKVGVLSCRIGGGVGFIIGSSKRAVCLFRPSNGARAERYRGSIGKLGGVSTGTNR